MLVNHGDSQRAAQIAVSDTLKCGKISLIQSIPVLLGKGHQRRTFGFFVNVLCF
jgi:hypothetical protein